MNLERVPQHIEGFQKIIYRGLQELILEKETISEIFVSEASLGTFSVAS
jgi:hypothetical protein